MKQGVVRIIAGKWRGRRLKVPAIKELRPTPDRVRETVFNWLSPFLSGANCLDLFAGSGVLGFEALSRGAASLVLIDQSAEIVQLLKEEWHKFSVNETIKQEVDIYRAIAPQGLRPVQQPFDIVFLDPPYQQDLLLPSCEYLEKNHFLAETAYIYLESYELIKENNLPLHWRIVKSAHAGQVFYHLAKREQQENNEHN